jgi:hypothetical protein
MEDSKMAVMATIKAELPFGYSYEKLLAYNEMIEDNWRGVELLRTKQYEEAERFYREMLGRFFQYQALTDDRYHKGTPFHNLALALVGQGKLREAAKNFVLAYIEDVLSFGDGIAESLPAERALYKMGLPMAYLQPVKAKALEERKNSHAPMNPEKIYLEFSRTFEEPGLQKMIPEDIMELISVETMQSMSAIVRFQTSYLETQIGRIESQVGQMANKMHQDRYVAWAGLIIGVVSLILGIIPIFVR